VDLVSWTFSLTSSQKNENSFLTIENIQDW
jgi:hypothetical protein